MSHDEARQINVSSASDVEDHQAQEQQKINDTCTWNDTASGDVSDKGVSQDVSDSSYMQKPLTRGVGRGKKPTVEAEELNRKMFARNEAPRMLTRGGIGRGKKSTAKAAIEVSRGAVSHDEARQINVSSASDVEDHQAQEQQKTNDTCTWNDTASGDVSDKGVSQDVSDSSYVQKLRMRGVGRGKKPTAETIEFNRKAFARHVARQRLYAKYPDYPHGNHPLARPGIKSTAAHSKLSHNVSPASDIEDHQAEELLKTTNNTPTSPASDGEDHQADEQQKALNNKSNDTPTGDISPWHPSFGNDMFTLTVENWGDVPPTPPL